MALEIQRLNFDPVTGDNPSEAFMKLDLDVGEIADLLALSPQLESGLGNSATRNVGIAAGTVAAGDDPRFSVAGFKNLLINGSFDVWQRGSVFTASGYNTDRFLSNASGSTFNVSQFATTAGVAYTSSRYGLLYAVTSVAGANNFCSFQQRIENVRLLAGKTVTVSFTAYASIAGKKIGVDIEQNFGTGGSPSAGVAGIGQSVTLTTAPARYSLTFAVPAITGKSFGTANNDFSELIFWMDAGSAFNTRSGGCGQMTANVAIHDLQLEVGTGATDYERRPLGLEMALCQRYFETSFSRGTTPSDNAATAYWPAAAFAAASVRAQNVPFRTTKRVPPAIKLYSPNIAGQSAGLWGIFTSGGTWAFGGSTAINISDSSFTVDISFGGGLAWGQSVIAVGMFSADAEL